MRERLVREFLSSAQLVLIATVGVVSVLGWLSSSVKSALILVPHRVRKNFEVHRLLTAGWVHADVAHLAFNMITLWFFADDVVQVLGATKFLLLYLSAVVVAFVPTTLRYMKKSRYSSLGASGAVAAVMFSAILLHPGLKLFVPFVPFRVPAIFYAVGYLAYSIWSSYASPDDVNHDAHFTGAAYGALLTYLLEPQRFLQSIRNLL